MKRSESLEMFSHCTVRSVRRIYCPGCLTIRIQLNVRWKRPAAGTCACPESSLRFSFATSPLIPAGLRETHWLRWEEGWWRGVCMCVWGVLGVQLMKPWPKLGLHDLTKNNSEQDGMRAERNQVCAHIHAGCVAKRHAQCI